MQTSRLRVPRFERITAAGGNVDKTRIFRFDPIFEPEIPSTLDLFLRGQSKDQFGFVQLGLVVGTIRMLSRKLTFNRRGREYRFKITDIAKSYGQIKLILRPQKKREFIISSGILLAPNPRFMYRVQHQFNTEADITAFGRLAMADLSPPAFADESDADDEYGEMVTYIQTEGADTTDLEDVNNVTDGTGVNRSVRKVRVSVPRDWSPGDGFV